MQPIGIIVIFMSVVAFAIGLNDRPCSNPSPYYNTYINNSRALKCPHGNTAQSVSAVFSLCSAPNTGNWKRNKQVNLNCSSIKRNTAIASFSGSGGTKYNGNQGHAAIFLSCLPGGDIRVADQWCGHEFSERTLYKKCSSHEPYSDCADKFYTFDW